MNEPSFLRKRGNVGHGRRQATRTGQRLIAALVALFLLGLTASSGTSAAVSTTFTVDSTADTADASVGDGVCANAAGSCTLRAAIAESNASVDSKDTIAFTGSLSIALESELPEITDPVDIDGTTQPGCAGSPIVEVQGSSTPHNHQGLVLNAGDSTVCGLALNRLYIAIRISSSDNRIEGNFIGTDVAGAAALANENAGISVLSGARNHFEGNVISGNQGYGLDVSAFSSENVIQGNHFGTNATGTAALTNGGLDLQINSDNDVIGGTVAAGRNVIAGNVVIGQTSTGALVRGNYFGTDETGGSALVPGGGLLQIQGAHSTIGGSEGITLGGSCTGACNVFANGLRLSAPFGEAGNHVVQGNFVGTDSSGMRALGGGWGVEIADSTDNLIGGTDPAERNLISGNALDGVLIANTSFRNRIVGNLIGTDASGTRPLPNGEGILCCGSGFGDDNTIEHNVIAFNRGEGVVIVGGPSFETVGNAILGNSIFANGDIGIDLGSGCCGNGPTQNDPGDGDAGPNGLQNFPVITGVTVDDGETTIEGTLNSRLDSTYHVELFRNSECDPSHFGEGETFLGSLDVSGDGSTFTVKYPVALSATEVVTSTATDSSNNTSEFSECLADLSITKSDDPDPIAVGVPLTYTIDVANDGSAPATAVRVTDTLPSDVTLTSITPSQGSCDESTVICTLGSIGRGGTARITIVVDPGSTPRTLTNTARVSSELRDPDESNNSAIATTQMVAEQPATIVVSKVTVPSPDPTDTSFGFTGGGGLSPASFSLKNGGSRTFADLVPRAGYGVAETTPSGWDSTGVCSDGSPVSNIDVAPGETVTCTFTNRKRGSVRLRKTTNGVVDPSKDISFVLTGPGLPSGGVSRSTFGDPDGVLDFGSGNLVPAQMYKICEAPVPAGFTSFWRLDGVIVTPYNPDASKSPPEDLGTRCYDFQVSPGQARAFEVDNSRPGGDPRTIGYWKNWNRCTGGNQAATAAKNGGAAAGFFLVEDLLPQLIGDFTVTSCQQAVKLLSKQDQSGKSKSSDAAYELGAQLLAARFNLAAGAETCLAVQQAVLDGQTLLDGLNFTGSGDFLGSKSKDPRRAQALSLAATLDRYNNNLLC